MINTEWREIYIFTYIYEVLNINILNINIIFFHYNLYKLIFTHNFQKRNEKLIANFEEYDVIRKKEIYIKIIYRLCI